MHEQAARASRGHFESGYYCAESVLLSVAEYKGVRSDLIPKIATGFCSGISRSSGMCGAVGGAVMAVSLFTGRQSPGESVGPCYDAVGELSCGNATGTG